MKLFKFILTGILLGLAARTAFCQDEREAVAGPFYARFPLTLAEGQRREAVGPFYYQQESGPQWQWALPPLFCYTRTADVDWTEWEVLYPALSYRRFGAEYRLSIFEFIAFSGGKSSLEHDSHRFTLFPLYFQQRGPEKEINYTALFPIYGNLQNRLFRDEINFLLFPLYSKTRKKDVITYNYLYPVFDLRRGDQLWGWQFWPVFGEEHKIPTFRTNNLDEREIVGGFDKYFAVWPFYFKNRQGLGTTNPQANVTMVPFYSQLRSPLRDSTSYGWPLGFNSVHDRQQKYVEHDLFWPFNVFAHGSKSISRVFPFYSQAYNGDLESDFYLWPVYKFNRLNSAPLVRKRTRIMFFLFSDTTETIADSHERTHRADLFPFYTYRREWDGSQRWQVFSILEPFLPNNRTIPREYSQVWSVWRCEKNHRTGAFSQSLLWNLYRHETTPGTKNFSLLFGLCQYEKGSKGWHLHFFQAKTHLAAAQSPVPQS